MNHDASAPQYDVPQSTQADMPASLRALVTRFEHMSASRVRDLADRRTARWPSMHSARRYCSREMRRASRAPS
jgi:hypothetical protein